MKDNNSYSQRSEQQVALDFFGDFKGNFLSIGESNGEFYSNVRALAEIGWGGVCVEPDKASFDELSQLYEGVDHIHCFNVAVSTETGVVPFYCLKEYLSGTIIGPASTLKKNEAHERKGSSYFMETTTNAMSWLDLLQISPIKKFDFVSIDAGGSDLEILLQMDLKGMGVKLLCIEWNSVREFRSSVDSFLRDYTLIHTNYKNLIYKLDGINN